MARLWRADVTLEALRMACRGTMVEWIGIELSELGDDFLSGTMPVDQRTCQPMRMLHGGASVALAETLASLAANSVVDDSRAMCVGQEINANHVRRAAQNTTVAGISRPFHIGASSQVWGIEINNDRGQLVCVARITMAVVRR